MADAATCDQLAASLKNDADRSAARTLRQNLSEWKTIHAQVVGLSDTGSFAGAQQVVTTTANPLLKAAEDAAQSIVRRHNDAMSEASAEATTPITRRRPPQTTRPASGFQKSKKTDHPLNA